ncbi:hypothetical protein HKBW3S03_02193, partial [Candidatus Hakubella thermalkaliphila]
PSHGIAGGENPHHFSPTVQPRETAHLGVSEALHCFHRGPGLDPGPVRRATIAPVEPERYLIINTRGGELPHEATPHPVGVEAVDTGPAHVDVEQALQPGFSTAPEWVCEMGFGAGMGLNNIQSCADEFEIEAEVGRGTRVRAVVHLSQSGRKDRLNR